MSKPLLQIIGSKGSGRVGLSVAEWTLERAVAQGAFDVPHLAEQACAIRHG